MKIQILSCLALLLFACGGPNTDLELEKILLINKNGERQNIEALSDLENEKDSSKRLMISYTFSKRNIKGLKSGLLQIDKRACFSLFLNNKLVLERKKDSFFQDTLLATKKDSFLYKNRDDVYFPLSLKKKAFYLNEGKNELVFQFSNQKYYKIRHKKTKLYLFKNNKQSPSKTPAKKLKTSSLPWLSINTKHGIQDEPKQLAELAIKNRKSVLEEDIQIEIRGTTSQSFQKKSFSFLLSIKISKQKKLHYLDCPSMSIGFYMGLMRINL